MEIVVIILFEVEEDVVGVDWVSDGGISLEMLYATPLV